MATIGQQLYRLGAQLERWQARLEAIAAEAEAQDSGVSVDHHRRIAALRAKLREAQATLSTHRRAAADHPSAEVEEPWTAVESAFFWP